MLTTLEVLVLYGLIYLSIERISSQQSLQTAQLKPSSISTVSGISVSIGQGVSAINDKWSVNVATQQGADLHVAMTEAWGFHPLHASSMQLTIRGNTSSHTYQNDGELLFVFSVEDDYFAEVVSLDDIKTSYKECPSTTSPLITRHINEMITSITPDRYHRFCGNAIGTPVNAAVDYWNNVGNAYKQPAQWPMFITIINDPVNNNIAYTWTDSTSGLNRVSSQYTSSFATNKGFNIFISGESPNEDFYIFSIDVAYRIHFPQPTLYPTNPSLSPTNKPTSPTNDPTLSPTHNPSVAPTNNPTLSPTSNPSTNPTISPTANPIISPTTIPTITPTKNPTNSPSVTPTDNPSTNPTINPSVYPTYIPTINPTMNPSMEPTNIPTYIPTVNPSIYPTNIPTLYPTIYPSTYPTILNVDASGTSTGNIPTKSPSKVVVTDVIMLNETNINRVLEHAQQRMDNDSMTWFHVMVIVGGVLVFCSGLIIIGRLTHSSRIQKRTMEGTGRRDNGERDGQHRRYNSESAMVPMADFLNVHIPIGMYEMSSRKTTDISKSADVSHVTAITPCISMPILEDYGASIHELHLKQSEMDNIVESSDTDPQLDNLYGRGTATTTKGDGESVDSFDTCTGSGSGDSFDI